MSRFTLRTAHPADADAVAAVFSPSLRLLRFLPDLHTVAEDRWFIGHVILAECSVTVAEEDGRVIASWHGTSRKSGCCTPTPTPSGGEREPN